MVVAYSFLLLLIVDFIYALIVFFRNKEVPRKSLIIISIIAVIVLSGIAYCIIPGKTTDLYAHFETIEKISFNGFSAKTSVDNLVIIKALFFMVSKTNNYHLLSMFTVLITYSIYFFIFNKTYYKNNKNLKKIDVISILLLFFALCNFYYIATGIKTALAYSLLALSFYLIDDNKKKLGYFLILISVFCHGSVLILVFFYLLSKFKLFTKCRFVLLFAFLFARLASVLFTNIPIPIFQYIGEKIVLYINRSTFTLNPIVLITEIILALLLIYRTQIIIVCKKNDNDLNLKNIYYIQTLLLLGIGTIFLSDIILERMLMLVAFLIPKLIISENKNKKNYFFVIDIFCSIILIAYFIVRLINHVSFL